MDIRRDLALMWQKEPGVLSSLPAVQVIAHCSTGSISDLKPSLQAAKLRDIKGTAKGRSSACQTLVSSMMHTLESPGCAAKQLATAVKSACG
jgi:hypothetical protein